MRGRRGGMPPAAARNVGKYPDMGWTGCKTCGAMVDCRGGCCGRLPET